MAGAPPAPSLRVRAMSSADVPVWVASLSLRAAMVI
jgi:hypothetical protein